MDNLKSLYSLPSDVNRIVNKYCEISRGDLMHSYELKYEDDGYSKSFDNFIYAHFSLKKNSVEIFTCGLLSATVVDLGQFYKLHVRGDGQVFIFHGSLPRLSIYTANGLKIGGFQLKIHHNNFREISFQCPHVQNNTFCIQMRHGGISTFQKYGATGLLQSTFHIQDAGAGCCYDRFLNTFVIHKGHIKKYSLDGDFASKIRVISDPLGLCFIDEKLCYYTRISDGSLEFHKADDNVKLSKTPLWKVRVNESAFVSAVVNLNGSVTEYQENSRNTNMNRSKTNIVRYFY